MDNSVFFAEKYTERTLIESVLSSFYILDYGLIKTVNPDKTIDVVHAKKLKMLDGTELKQTVTRNVEVLTLAGAGFSITFDYKKGDKVLLLGFKNYIPKVEKVTSATETTDYQHYTRECLKAIPMCVFKDDAKATVVIKDGKIELNGNTKHFVTWEELNTALNTFMGLLNSHTHTGGGSGTPSTPMTLNIANAKTKTIVTGG
ncbi:MAG: hypothetical protein IKY42_01955 [Bacteroidaceae bacterium]|nr:hypothetical protein [Bacteroidaceae bacterium]